MPPEDLVERGLFRFAAGIGRVLPRSADEDSLWGAVEALLHDEAARKDLVAKGYAR